MDIEQPLGTWSFSRIQTYNRCPYKLFLQRTNAPRPPENPDAPHVRGQRLHTDIENYIRGDTDQLENTYGDTIKFTIENLRQQFKHGKVRVEEDWFFTIEWTPCTKQERWNWIKLDACLDTPEPVVFDWKSGKSDGKQIEHRSQGQLYALATSKLFPDRGRYHVLMCYLDEDKTTSMSFTQAALDRAQTTWDLRGHTVASATHLPPNPLPHNCRFCDYGNTNGTGVCDFASE